MAGLWTRPKAGRNMELVKVASGEHPWESQYDLSVHSLHSALLATYWAKRGWTFQEQLLSKRAIVFLDGVIFWDCQHYVWWPEPDTTFAPIKWKWQTADNNRLTKYGSQNASLRNYPLKEAPEASRKLS